VAVDAEQAKVLAAVVVVDAVDVIEVQREWLVLHSLMPQALQRYATPIRRRRFVRAAPWIDGGALSTNTSSSGSMSLRACRSMEG
jgi:hypothetical protein